MADLDYQYLMKLVSQAKRGDSDSFAELYAATYQKQYRFAYHFLKDPYLAQDSLHHLYIMVLKNLDLLTDPQNFISWLDQIHPQICRRILAEHSEDVAKRTLYNPESRGLDLKSADILLTSIFTDCGMEPNTVPLSTLTSYRIYRRENYILPKAVITILLLGLCLVPLLFILPSSKITPLENIGRGQPQYSITVSSPLRVKSVTATIGGEEQNIYESANKLYTLAPTTNGNATVTITLENGQYTTEALTVTGVDENRPELLEYTFEDNSVKLTVSDSGSGIDYTKITAQDADGNSVKLISYDEATGVVIFPYPSSNVDVYIPDQIGNTLHAQIHPRSQ